MPVDESRPTSIPGVATFHPREAWQDPNLPVTGPSPTMEQWDTFPLHYTAADDLIDGDPGEHAEDLPAYLRAIQRDYKLNRGYSVGYGFAVDWRGGVWELRGYDIKNAANRYWNHRTGPVLCLVDGADPLTDEALWSVRALYREANRRTGRTLDLAGHRDIGATACPGDGIYRQITDGLVTPLTDAELNPTPEPPEREDDMARPVIIIDGYLDQFELYPIGNVEQRRKAGIPDTQQPIPAKVDPAAVEQHLTYRLTPKE